MGAPMETLTGTFLVCLGVAEAAVLIPGARRGTCGTCQAPVWITATGRALLLDGSIEHVVCLGCARKDPHIEIEGPTAEQRAEFEQNVGRPISQAEWIQTTAEIL